MIPPVARLRYDIVVVNNHPRIRLPRAPIVDDISAVFRGENIRRAVVTVILTSDEHLLQINREFLNHDYYTDVITFGLEESPLEGEVYLSVDRAKEQAREFGVGLYQEVRRLAIHGALHLAGYDDATDELRGRMGRLEDRYLRR